jgi:predicted Zn-dependent peptidase
VLQNSSAGGIASFLSFLDLHGLGRDYLEDYTQRVYAVTPEDVRRITEEYIREDDLAIVVVGDRSVVEEQLTPFGDVTIETIE